ncbi:PTS glucose transporter subunit IIA [Paenibacillus campi]|uniref:PTS sugar transporter subunit IIA n=1 Tax=Paenibacillus campi TaxID=3106031 RepID=UPI002AFDCA16|nr:PTS glucose transporter subunit IIA [Paenibacillus sp. SGZ-1014]
MLSFFKKDKTSPIEAVAPLTGKAVDLSDVPDPAFAEKLMGQGIAIEPQEGKVHAPFDGKIAQLFKTKHALLIEHSSGIQVLIHVGVDTVSLKGTGFTAHIATGDKVKQGQLLLEFDIEQIQAAGYPIITPFIVPDGQDGVKSVTEHPGDVTAGQQLVLTIQR